MFLLTQLGQKEAHLNEDEDECFDEDFLIIFFIAGYE